MAGRDLLKWVALLIVFQCFDYKAAHSPLSWEIGLTITPDRLVFLILLMLASSRFLSGALRFPNLGAVGAYMLFFALICTVSTLVSGTGLGRSPTGHTNLTALFDFTYGPFIIFLIAKSIPQTRETLDFLGLAFRILGTYLAINGAFEHFGLHALVWPKYILDPNVGIQFGRTRGSFVSSVGLGGALIVTLLFYILATTRAKGGKLFWSYIMVLLTAGVIYTTNHRSVWVSFAFCLAVLTTVRSGMKRAARLIAGLSCLVFFSGFASHFSFAGPTLFSQRQETVEYRLVNYVTLLEMAKANPIFGIGYGNFRTEWPKYFRPVPGFEVKDLTDGNHSTYLGLLAEVGLAGILPYLLTLYSMFGVGLRVFRRGEGREREFALVSLLVISSFTIDASFGDYRKAQFLNTVLGLLFGTVARLETQMHSSQPVR